MLTVQSRLRQFLSSNLISLTAILITFSLFSTQSTAANASQLSDNASGTTCSQSNQVVSYEMMNRDEIGVELADVREYVKHVDVEVKDFDKWRVTTGLRIKTEGDTIIKTLVGKIGAKTLVSYRYFNAAMTQIGFRLMQAQGRLMDVEVKELYNSSSDEISTRSAQCLRWNKACLNKVATNCANNVCGILVYPPAVAICILTHCGVVAWSCCSKFKTPSWDDPD